MNKLIDEKKFLKELKENTLTNQVLFAGGNAIKVILSKHLKDLPKKKIKPNALKDEPLHWTTRAQGYNLCLEDCKKT